MGVPATLARGTCGDCSRLQARLWQAAHVAALKLLGRDLTARDLLAQAALRLALRVPFVPCPPPRRRCRLSGCDAGLCLLQQLLHQMFNRR